VLSLITRSAGPPTARTRRATTTCEPGIPGETDAKERSDQSIPCGLAQFLFPREVFATYLKEPPGGFEGRAFVFDALNDLIEDAQTPSGYLLLRGDPGIGKSAVIAELVRRYPSTLYHFNSVIQRITSHARCLGNICAQLIVRFQLPYQALPGAFDEDGTFLNRVLAQASQRLQPGQVLLIAVDALDEMESVQEFAMTNPLFLPLELPANIYVILTARRQYGLDIQASCIHECALDAPEKNEPDVRRFVERRMGWDGIRVWMEDRGLTDKGFVDLMWRQSEGNLMYLYHILPAIARSDFSSTTARDLPYGLQAYYRHHWAQMREQDAEVFARIYEPVICVLAAAEEAIPLDQVVKSTKLKSTQVQRVLRDWWEFLRIVPDEEEGYSYRLYHAAFREFLSREIDAGLKRHHGMIADSALERVEEEKRRQAE